MERVESQAQVPENWSGAAGSPRSKPQIQSEAEETEETNTRRDRRCEGHHKKFIFVFLRSPWVIRKIPTQAAVAVAALLFLCMSPSS